MINKKFSFVSKITVSFLAIAMVLSVAMPAFAASIIPSAKKTANESARIARIIARSDKAIQDRIDRLNKLSERVQSLKNVDDATKTQVSTNIQNSIVAMNTLKTKIDADTDLTTLIADAKSITGDYRIYALIIPQGYITASSDRIATVAAMMTTLGTKLQDRLTTAQTAGHDITALQSALTDMNSKIADAQTQGNNAKASIASLVPDNGDKTILASNDAAIKSAHVSIKSAIVDLQAARKDIKTIISGLKTLDKESSIKTSTSTKTTTQ